MSLTSWLSSIERIRRWRWYRDFGKSSSTVSSLKTPRPISTNPGQCNWPIFDRTSSGLSSAASSSWIFLTSKIFTFSTCCCLPKYSHWPRFIIIACGVTSATGQHPLANNHRNSRLHYIIIGKTSNRPSSTGELLLGERCWRGRRQGTPQKISLGITYSHILFCTIQFE